MSPTILMRSGVGAEAQLARLGVDVRQAPGVGKNLSDHPALAVVCQVRDPSLIDFDRPIIQTILRYTAKVRTNVTTCKSSRSALQVGPAAHPIHAGAGSEYHTGAVSCR